MRNSSPRSKNNSSWRDLHNALLCTVLVRSKLNFCSNIAEKFANFFCIISCQHFIRIRRSHRQVTVAGVRGGPQGRRAMVAAPGENVTFDGTVAVSGWARWKVHSATGEQIWRTTAPVPRPVFQAWIGPAGQDGTTPAGFDQRGKLEDIFDFIGFLLTQT